MWAVLHSHHSRNQDQGWTRHPAGQPDSSLPFVAVVAGEAVLVRAETAASAVFASDLPRSNAQTCVGLARRRRCGGQCSLHLVNIALKAVLGSAAAAVAAVPAVPAAAAAAAGCAAAAAVLAAAGPAAAGSVEGRPGSALSSFPDARNPDVEVHLRICRA